MSADPPPDPEPDDADVFVEVDPTGRYGRYREVLGKGAFKKVYKAFDELEGIEVAWNQVKVTDMLRNSVDMERLFSEVHLLKTLKHKNIIKFYNSWVDTKRDNINFITEVFTSGTLRQYRMKHQHVDIRALKNWSRQILSGLLYLHSHDPPVIHRDLKCDNIFVNGNQGEVKIGDLGLAAILGHTQSAHSVIGTPEFMAPELYEEEYNELIDIYAFGMCLLEMVTFEYPYCECSNPAQIFKKVTSGVKPASLSKVQDPDIKQFIEKCIAKASERLPARDLLMDPFLRLDPENGSVGNSSSSDLNRRGTSSNGSVGNSSSSDLNRNGSVGNSSSSDLNRRDNLEFSNPSAPSNTDNTDLITNGRDFMVKGQRKNVNTIIIKLSIADATRHVHTIHFPFEIEADTSISVATEMVAEFDLTDQDVTAIAEAIDAEIQAYVPQWVGSFEDDIDNEATDDLEAEDVLSSLRNESNHATGGFVLQHLSSGRRYWSDSPRARGSGMDSPSRLTHSNHRDDDFSVNNSPEQEDGGNNSPGQEDGGNNSPGQENGDGYSPHRTSSSNHRNDGNLEVIASFESLNLRSQSPDDSRNGTIADKDDRNDRCSDKALPESDPESFKLVSDKLEHLLIEQQEELESLRKKHDMAISDILKELPPELCRTTLSIFGLRGHEYLGHCEAGEHSGHSYDSTKTTAD